MCFSLHLLQPDRDFVWGRRDGIGDADGENTEYGERDTKIAD